MAQSTDERRPEFPDNDHPLRTPDEDAQRQVVARIAQARKGKGAPRGRGKRPEGAGHHVTLRRGLPMGEHPRVSGEELGKALGCGRTKAGELARHPENLDPWQVRQLCELCGVTLEWLRGWEDVNAYGRYETADTVAAMYSHLSNEDRTLVCDLLTRLLGADAVRVIKHEQWRQDNREWLKHNPKRAEEIARSVQKAFEPLWEPMRSAFESIQAYAKSVKDRYTDEEWELMGQTADRLRAQGEDADHMTPDELLAIARGEYVVP